MTFRAWNKEHRLQWLKQICLYKTLIKRWIFNDSNEIEIRLHLLNCLNILKYIWWLLKACVRYFLSNFYFPLNYRPSKAMKNIFLFHLPNQFRKNCQFKQQPLRGGGGIFSISRKGEDPYMGGLGILWGDLITR